MKYLLLIAGAEDGWDHMSQDEQHKNSTKVQELTDKIIKEIDATLAAKEVEIQKV